MTAVFTRVNVLGREVGLRAVIHWFRAQCDDEAENKQPLTFPPPPTLTISDERRSVSPLRDSIFPILTQNGFM